MKKRLAGVLLAAALAACGPRHASFVGVDSVALGRVVIYRNGVAFYERRTTVSGGNLTVRVPRERVDDFLKSLTVVDGFTNQPLPVSIPRQQTEDGTNLVMTLQLPSTAPADVVLTYVTESPAWKPSYRVVVGTHHDVMLEGWAIVDNTSGEDWKNVLVGVGSSSALSFRYDLWSVRQVQRETLANEARFAIAPPTGVSPYPAAGSDGAGGEVVLGELRDDEIRRPEGHPGSTVVSARDRELRKMAEAIATSVDGANGEAIVIEGRAPVIERSQLTGSASVIDGRDLQRSARSSVGDVLQARPRPSPQAAPSPRGRSGGAPTRISARDAESDALAPPSPEPPPPATQVTAGDRKMKEVSQALVHSDKAIVVEGYASASDPESNRRASDRANIVRNQLIDQGVAPARIKVVTKVDPTQQERVRLVAQAAPIGEATSSAGTRGVDVDAQPVGESHFASTQPVTVDRGSSAMVSMVRSPTEGEEVYLYDAESERGNAHFAFRAVRFKNPTDSTLETGPVTVYGQERFIGEGLTEPIPPKASAVVPFALDRQIVVERNDGEDDKISRLMTLSRGILTANVQHIRRRRLTITNRLGEVAKVFIRHTVNKGWTLLDAPPAFQRVGDAHLFEVQLAPHEVKEVMIAEATPIERTLDLAADVTLDMMKAWIESPEGTPEIKDQLRKLLASHRALVDLGQEQLSLRRRLADYRGRMTEIHNQIFSLQAVKTSGELMAHLKLKMKEISDRVQKTTIQIVDQEEKIMLARVQFQDTLAELVLPDAIAAPAASSASGAVSGAKPAITAKPASFGKPGNH